MSQPFHMPSTQPLSNLFAKSNGLAIKFFVETAAVQERPKLVRRIQKHGGSIVSSARDADILLAENNTKEALEILDAWAANKVVLSVHWVARCIDNNEFLGNEQDWGNLFLNRDELRECFTGIDDEYQDAEDFESNVNETSQSVRPKRKLKTATVSKDEIRINRTPISSSSGQTSVTPPSKRRKVVPRQTGGSNDFVHPTAPIPPPDAGASSPVTPVGASSTLPTTQDLQAVLQQQALVINYFSGLFQQASQQPQDAFAPFVGSTVNPMNIACLPLFNPTQRPPQQFGLPQQLMLNPLMFPSQPREAMVPSMAYQNHQITPSRPTPEDVEVASEDQSSQSASEVEIAVLNPKRKASRSSTSSFNEETIQTAIRSKPIRALPARPPPKVGIFTDDKGLPSKFFVTLDLRNRKELLQIIRKHGGEMVLRMEVAQYIILNSRSPQFQQSLELLPLDKIALSPTWLQECDKTGVVAGLAGHIIDVDSGHGRGAARKKPVSTRKKRVAKPANIDCESEEGAVDPPIPSQVRMEAPQKILLQNDLPEDPGQSSSPSPSTTMPPKSGGKDIFTKVDRKWFFQYARFKLERNPNLSVAQLMAAVERKAPHHSAASWSSIVSTEWQDEMDALQQEIRRMLPNTSQEGGQMSVKSPNKPVLVPNQTPSGATASGMNSSEYLGDAHTLDSASQLDVKPVLSG